MIPLLLQAWKSWKSAKAVALLVVVALAVGIGSATAIYIAIDSMMLKPVPYAHGERFVSVLGAAPTDPNGMSSLPVKDILEYQQARSFDLFGWFRFANYNLTAPGQPQYLEVIEVTPALANGIGVKPELGQWFRDASQPVAMLSYALWQRLGGDPAIVGKPITLNARVYTVTGVMPRGFLLPIAGVYSEAPMDLWLPLDPTGRGQEGSASLFGYARLRPGVSAAQADAEVKSMAADIVRRDPSGHRNYTTRVDDLRELVTKDIKPVLLLLFGAAELLLLITCANVGGLLVARSVARSRDTAIRVALGARVRQLGLQYFLEGLFVSIPGALAGLLLAAALVRAIVIWAGPTVARLQSLSVDWRVGVFALVSALAAGALTGIAPLWQAVRTLPSEVLSDGVRSSAGARSRRLSQGLVVTEIALAFVLLSLSSVLVGELRRLTHQSPGFDPSQVLTFKLTLDPQTMASTGARFAYLDRLVEALKAAPGVTDVGLTNQLPLNGCCYTARIVPQAPADQLPHDLSISFVVVNPGYWSTMRIPLRRGRLLDRHDTGEAPLPVVVNQKAVDRFWPRQDAVGALGHFGTEHGDPFQVVGVVGDVKNNGLDNPTTAEIYVPAAVVASNPVNFVLRSPLPLPTLAPEVRAAIQRVNASQPIYEVQPMTAIVQDSMAVKRMSSYAMTFFALSALLMAMIGAYGVVSYSVQQRTVEIGTRLALGAVSRDVLKLVVGSGLRMAAVGIAIGAAAAAAATWALVRNFEVAIGNGGAGRIQSPGVWPFIVPAVVIAGVSAGSSFFPAWWATLLSPMVAIRNQSEPLWQSMRQRLGVLFERRAGGDDLDAPPPEATLSAELTEASRHAGSFREALQGALQALRARTGAQSALLLERAAGAYRSGDYSIPSLSHFSASRFSPCRVVH